MKNKMWQRLTSLLLVVCMVFGMSVNVFAAPLDSAHGGGNHEPKGCHYVRCETCKEFYVGGHPDDDNDRHCDYCDVPLNHDCTYYYDAKGHWGDCQSENDKVLHIYNSNDVCKICGYKEGSDVKLPEPTVETYKITVNPSENGSVTAPAEAEAGETVTLTVSPAEGFELDTLTLSVKDESGAPVEVEVTDNSFPMPASNVTVTASFKAVEQKPVSYGIEFNGSAEGRRDGKKVYVIENITDYTELTIEDWGYVNIVRPDHKVIAWGNDNGSVNVGDTVTGADLQAIDKKTYEGRVYLYPVWGPKDYTLHLQGGDYATLPTGKHVAYKTYSATEEVEFTNFDFTREGYTLTSWNNNHHYYNVGDTVSMKQINDDSWKPYEDEKVVLSAIWEANNYKVKFDGNGATSGVMADMDFIYDEAQTLTANAYERVEGKNQFKFLGWNTAADGSGESYADQAEVSNLTTEANGVVTLYAQWEQISTGLGDVTPVAARYIVNYYKQNDAGAYVFAERFISEPMELDAEVVAEDKAYEGYKLNAEESVMSGTVISEKDGKPAVLVLNVYYDKLYPVNVVIYRNGNLETPYKTVGLEKVEKGATFNVSSLNINNYYSSSHGFKFDGFFNDGGFNNYKANGSATALSGEITINGWTNLIAVVTDYEKVVVKAVTNGDTANAETIHSGTALRGSLLFDYLNKIEVAEKTGYTMDKWYKWDSPAWKFGETDTVNGWTNVRVNYTANNYKVKFDGNGATSGKMAEQSFTYDVEQPLTANAFTRVENDGKDQFKFIGWSTSADGKAVYTDGQSVSNLTAEANGVVTLYAQWEQISTGSTPIGDVTAARYVVEYYKQDSNGQYVKDEAETFMSDAVAIGTEVTAEQKEFGGYKLNEGKSELSGIVSFNSQAEVPFLTLKVYYDALTDVTITVEWDDDNNRDGLRVVDKDVIVELLTNGKKASGKKVKLSASEESDSATFSMLKFDNGSEIAYSVNDVNGESIHYLPDGYTVEVSNEGNEWTVVLKHEPARMDMDVTVVWDDEDNRDGFRPSDMKLELVKNKHKQGDKKIPITTEDNKTYTYENLYVYENGEEINYSVVGAFRPASYSETVTGNMEDGFQITLKHEPERMDMDVTVVWDDDNNRDGIRPSNMKLELVKNKDKQGDKKIPITTEDNKTYTYENLYVYENGKEINYTVVGAFRPASYSETVTGNMEDGYTVTLKHEPVQTGDVTVTVKWNDDSNRDGIRPASIRNDVSLLGKAVPAENVLVKLFRSIIGDEPVGEALAINEDGDIWTYTFPSSYKYSDVGQLVDLVAKLNKVPDGYSMSVNGTNIMLTHMPELIDISGTITWKDGSDYDNIRPDNVVIKLIGDDKEYEETFNSMAGNVWEYEFAGVHKYLNGKEIEYSVSQNKVPGYTTTIKNFDITNIHSPNYPEIEDEPEEKVVVKVKWFNDDSSYRPEEVTVQLYKDGRKYRAAAELSADKDIYENWRHVWKDVNEDKDTEWSIKVNGIPSEYIYEIEQVRSSYFVVNCTLNENEVKKNPETGAF